MKQTEKDEKIGEDKRIRKAEKIGKDKALMADETSAIDEALRRFNDEDLWALAARADEDRPFEFSREKVEQMRRILNDYMNGD